MKQQNYMKRYQILIVIDNFADDPIFHAIVRYYMHYSLEGDIQ
jgi:hypothetical protein